MKLCFCYRNSKGEERTMPASPSKSPGAQTVDRALRILRSFLSGSPRKSLQAIAQEQGLHKSIAFRLLRSLEEQGFVQQDPVTKEYRLGLTLLELGEAARAGLDMRQEALPFIAELVQQTGETAYLTVRSGSEAVCVEVQESPSAVRVAYRVGLRHPLHLGAAGKVLLAFEEEALGQFLLRRGQEMSPCRLEGLHRELARIRDQGYAYTAGELEEEASGVAVPVFDRNGTAVAALGFVGPSHRITPERAAQCVPLVLAAGRALSRRLGQPRAQGEQGEGNPCGVEKGSRSLPGSF